TESMYSIVTIELLPASHASEFTALDVTIHHADRHAHTVSNLLIGDIFEQIQEKGFAAPGRQGFDSVEVGLHGLRRSIGLLGLQRLRAARLICFQQGMNVVVLADAGTAFPVDSG